MSNVSVNIAISGLGISTTAELKVNLRRVLPDNIVLNWTNIADQNIDCLFVNEAFFENENIQKIIIKDIPYLKISKNDDENLQKVPDLISVPITQPRKFEDWINHQLLKHLSGTRTKYNGAVNAKHELKDISFFTKMYENDSSKLHVKDQFGTVAILDHRAHCVWLDPARTDIQTDATVQYHPASTGDFIKVSRKLQLDLENWLFHLVWNSEQFTYFPRPDEHFKINYWVQPFKKDRKLILQLSAAFALGGKVQDISDKLNIPLEQVQKFIVAHSCIQNAQPIAPRDCKFGQSSESKQSKDDSVAIKSFFKKLKNKFGF